MNDYEMIKSPFATNTCYRSYSHPTKYLELRHSFPTGPIHIYVETNILIYFSDINIEHVNLTKKYYYLRVNGSCPSSMILIINNFHIRKIILRINILLFDDDNRLATIIYNFNNGFILNNYLLVEIYSNFGILVDITKNQKHNQSKIINFTDDLTHLKSISQKCLHLCVVTPQNRAIVIKPIYNNGLTPGFITQIIGKYTSEEISREYEYTAFECQADENSYNERVIFVDEEFDDAQLSFIIIYREYDLRNIISHQSPFTITNPKRMNINKLRYITSDKRILFFINPTHLQLVYHPDHSSTIYYFSANDIVYDERRMVLVYIVPHVIRVKHKIISQSVSPAA